MDAVTLLQEHIDVVKLLEHYDFDKARPSGGYVRSCCKLHGGNNPTAFVISQETGRWYCHTGSCGGGDAYTLVQRMEECTFEESVRWIAHFFHVDIENIQITERKEAYITELKSWVKAMTSRKKKSVAEFSISEPIKEVTKFRTFSEETLRHFQLGWVESIVLEKKEHNEQGDKQYYTLKNRLTIPLYQNGVRIGYSLRRVRSKDVPKWSHQPSSIETRNILYNYDMVLGSSEIVVCEGITDVWAYHEIGIPAVCTFGAHLTDEQYKMLMRTGADITLSYDGDEAGSLATEVAINMLKYKANIKKVVFESGNDPESIERAKLKQLYESRVRV